MVSVAWPHNAIYLITQPRVVDCFFFLREASVEVHGIDVSYIAINIYTLSHHYEVLLLWFSRQSV